MATLKDPHPETGRRLITVAQWDQRPDELRSSHAYIIDQTAKEYSAEVWTTIDEIQTNGVLSYDLWFASGQMMTVGPDYLIYISANNWLIMAHQETLRAAADRHYNEIKRNGELEARYDEAALQLQIARAR